MDINCDMGELPDAIASGFEESLMQYITSANIACGGHAGDAATMETTVRAAIKHGLAIGAHPGYPDPANFGRLELNMPPEAIAQSVYDQVAALDEIADRLGARITHVKAHGALYNVAVKKRDVAQAIADGTARYSKNVTLFGLLGSPMLDVFQAAGFRTAAEAFADRRYEPDGTLRPRKHAGALITDPEEAAAQALRLALEAKAQTICIHSDTPGSLAIVTAVKRRLREAGIPLSPLSPAASF